MSELPEAWLPARVVGQHRREWDVATTEGVERAVLAGKQWAKEGVGQLDDAQPTVGDWVAVLKEPGAPPVIHHILKRRTWLSRTSMARRGARQTLVANVDRVAIVAAFAAAGGQDAVAKRSLHPRRIERYVAAVRTGGAEPLVVLNKSDLEPEAEARAEKLRARLKKTEVVTSNCMESDGLGRFLSAMSEGETIGLVGLSGVGKSSLVNRIIGKELQKIGEERTSDSRGRHTTTHRELFQTEGGLLLIDTPGMREFALADASETDLGAFEDVVEAAQGCQFRDCKHVSEPGCAVLLAVENGTLSRDRVENYRTLALELKTNSAQKPLTRLGRGKRQKYPSRKDRSWSDDD